ncbi:hypothetical protein T06_12631 [Trichinella sp. T6]|nr:hypothetical protein T06_12631 [Trichinella sp. T6]
MEIFIIPKFYCLFESILFHWASLNSSASHFPQTPPPFCDWLYSDRLHTIDR